MNSIIRKCITVLCLLPLFSAAACQSLGLYRIGIGEKETPLIEEEHRKTCEQPAGSKIGRDGCGRVIYGDGSKY